MREWKNYKWTLAGIPNGIFLCYLIPSRYPMTIRGTIGYLAPMMGWWGHKRAAHNRTVDIFKKQMIIDHYESTANPDPIQKEKARKLLFGETKINEEAQQS